MSVSDDFQVSEIKIPESKTHTSGKSSEWYLSPDTDSFSTVEIVTAEGDVNYFEVSYKDVNEYIFGKYIYIYYSEALRKNLCKNQNCDKSDITGATKKPLQFRMRQIIDALQ